MRDYMIKGGGKRYSVCAGINTAINEARRRAIKSSMPTVVTCTDDNGAQVFRLEVTYPGPRNNRYSAVDTWTWYNGWIGSTEPLGTCHWSHESRERELRG